MSESVDMLNTEGTSYKQMKAIVQHTSSSNFGKCQKMRNSSLKTGNACARVRKCVIFVSEIPWDHARESTRWVTLPTCQSRSAWQVNHLCRSWQPIFSKVYGHESKWARTDEHVKWGDKAVLRREKNKCCKYAKKRWSSSTHFLVPGNSGEGWGLSDASISDQSSPSHLVDAESCCRNWRVSSPAARAKQVRDQLIERTCAFNHKIHVQYSDSNRCSHACTYLHLGYGTASCSQSVWSEGLGGQSWSWPGGSGPEYARCTGT